MSIKLEKFENPGSKEFKTELKKAKDYLPEEQALRFFKIMHNHFRHDIDSQVGCLVLDAFHSLLKRDEIRKIYIEKGFVSALPLDKKDFLQENMNILFLFVALAPEVFDELLCLSFQKIIPHCGEKSLILITNYSLKFSELQEPWFMLDLLFHNRSRFSKPDLVEKFSCLLATLVETIPEFCYGRGQNAYAVLIDLLKVYDNVQILITLLNNICRICAYVKDMKIELALVSELLKYKEIKLHVIDLLLVIPPDTYDQHYVRQLLRTASKSVKATLILMRHAQDPQFAEILTIDPVWMEKDLPTFIDTLRLFFVVFRHANLRSQLTSDSDFPFFLLKMLKQKRIELFSMSLMIIRRINPLTEDLIQSLSDIGYLTLFFEMAESFNNVQASHDAILLADTIGKIAFTHELLLQCDQIAYHIKSKGELMKPATIAAIDLCCQHKLAKKFKELHLVEFFKKIRKDDQYKKISNKFLEAVQETV